MPIVEINAFVGQHCETTVLVNLLRQQGIDLTEPMVFGLAQGFNYIFWDSKSMDFPFIGGRIKPDLLTKQLTELLGLDLDARETQSLDKAWTNVVEPIKRGQLVGLKLDHYHLDYFAKNFHFPAHYVTLYGFDDHNAFLIDTVGSKGKNQTSLESLRQARSYKGPMASKSLSLTITKTKELRPLDNLLLSAIRENTKQYLNPPIKNIGYMGILKTSQKIKTWIDEIPNPNVNLPTIAFLMEKGGTGGGLFRKLYADFLDEGYQMTARPQLKEGSRRFQSIAMQWKEVADHIDRAGKYMEPASLYKASTLLEGLATQERETAEMLYEACA